jgi:hypothetical protein
MGHATVRGGAPRWEGADREAARDDAQAHGRLSRPPPVPQGQGGRKGGFCRPPLSGLGRDPTPIGRAQKKAAPQWRRLALGEAERRSGPPSAVHPAEHQATQADQGEGSGLRNAGAGDGAGAGGIVDEALTTPARKTLDVDPYAQVPTRQLILDVRKSLAGLQVKNYFERFVGIDPVWLHRGVGVGRKTCRCLEWGRSIVRTREIARNSQLGEIDAWISPAAIVSVYDGRDAQERAVVKIDVRDRRFFGSGIAEKKRNQLCAGICDLNRKLSLADCRIPYVVCADIVESEQDRLCGPGHSQDPQGERAE